MDLLLASGVTHVINLASFVDNFFQEKLIYKTISARDIPEFQVIFARQPIHDCSAAGRKPSSNYAILRGSQATGTS